MTFPRWDGDPEGPLDPCKICRATSCTTGHMEHEERLFHSEWFHGRGVYVFERCVLSEHSSEVCDEHYSVFLICQPVWAGYSVHIHEFLCLLLTSSYTKHVNFLALIVTCINKPCRSHSDRDSFNIGQNIVVTVTS